MVDQRVFEKYVGVLRVGTARGWLSRLAYGRRASLNCRDGVKIRSLGLPPKGGRSGLSPCVDGERNRGIEMEAEVGADQRRSASEANTPPPVTIVAHDVGDRKSTRLNS